MIQLLDLPEEILLELIIRFLSVSECMNLVSTCRFLHKFTHLKAFWLRIAHFARKTRPLPFEEDGSRFNLSMETIRDETVRSLMLGKLLKQRSLPHPKRVRELILPDISGDFAPFDDERSQVEDMGPRVRDPQIWAWLLKDGKHLLSMSKVGILKVWDMVKEKVVASMDVMGNPLCWDYMMDEKGLTMIVNVETRDSEQETFRAWRYNWVDPEPKILFKKALGGDIRSNWIEGTLTGCVGIVDDNFTFIYIINWVTLDEAYIDTQLGLPSNLSAATSRDMLFIYAEDTTHAVYSSYSLSHLSNLLAKSMNIITAAPTIEQQCTFRQDGVDSLNFWIPTCRVLWDGRTGVFSRSMRIAPAPETFVADYATLSIVELFRDTNGEVMERHSGGTVTRHIAHWFDPDISELLAAPADWDVCAMGTFAKTAVWMERMKGDAESDKSQNVGRVRICFAEFPAEAEVDGLRERRDDDDGNIYEGRGRSGLETGSQERETGPSTDHPTPVDWWEGLIGEPVLANNTDGGRIEEEPANSKEITPAPHQEDSITTPHEGTPVAGELEGFDPMPDHSVSDGEIPAPVSFGHFCEYEMDEDWEKHYGGIYTVDFDDARGVAAFATGSGKIVLFEFV